MLVEIAHQTFLLLFYYGLILREIPPSPYCWDYSCASLPLAYIMPGIEPRDLYIQSFDYSFYPLMNITTTRLYCGKRLISCLCTVYRDVSGHLFIYFRILLFSSVDCDLSVWLIYLVCRCMCEYSCGGQKSTLGAILLVPSTSFIFLFYNIYLFLFYAHGCFMCIYICASHSCLVAMETRRKHLLPWNWSWRCLWATMWVLNQT